MAERSEPFMISNVAGRLLLLLAATALAIGAAAAAPAKATDPIEGARELGARANAQGLARILSAGDRTALRSFVDGYVHWRTGPEGYRDYLPSDLESVIELHFRDPDPWIGSELHNMLTCKLPEVGYRHRELFDAMYEELEARTDREADYFQWIPTRSQTGTGYRPSPFRTDENIVCTNLPGIESDLLNLLGNGHSLNLDLSGKVIEFLARRRYEPAVSVLVELQAKAAANAWIARRITEALLAVESASSMEAVRNRLRWLKAQRPSDAVNAEIESILSEYPRALGKHHDPGFVALLASHYDLAPLVAPDQISNALILAGTRESLDAVVRHLAWLRTQTHGGEVIRESEMLIEKLLFLPGSAPLDIRALLAALPADLKLDVTKRVLDMAARHDESALPWPSGPPVVMTREQCERSRERDFPTGDDCYGVLSIHHEILDACAAYRPNFSHFCGGPKSIKSPLAEAALNRDEYALMKMLDNGATLPYPGALAGLAIACARDLETLPWCERVIKVLVQRGADINEAFQMASTSGNPKVTALLDILIALGADVNRQDVHGCTALDRARLGELDENHWPDDYGPNTARVAYLARHQAKTSLTCGAHRLFVQAPRAAAEISYLSICMLGGCTGH